jgi:antitoxin MazE
MKTRKLVLEISDALFSQLQQLSTLKEESIESVAIRMIASQIHGVTTETQDFNELLDKITPEMLHGEINSGESVGREFW